MMFENGRISGEGDPNAPPTITHGRTYSTASRGSGLRNEVKFADEAEGQDHPNDTSRDAFMDAPLYAHGSRNKAGQPQVYSHNHSGSRSNLAPVNSNPAYQQAENTQQRGLPYPQYSQAVQPGRYHNPASEEYADYYTGR